jgi:hypothetical protein
MDEPLWRYFKTERFLDFLKTGNLYFSSARQFQDPFEGAVAVIPPGFPTDPRYAEPEHHERAFEALRRLTKISCWHRARYESDAMWQLYAGSWKGVAIRTTPERIATSTKPFRLKPEYGEEDLWAGSIKYVDLLKERLSISTMAQFWHKHMAFSWEQEFRLAISLRMAEEYGVSVPDEGIFVQFDISSLVDKIYLGPSLSTTDAEAVRKSATELGIEDRIRVSSLLGTPRYV